MRKQILLKNQEKTTNYWFPLMKVQYFLKWNIDSVSSVNVLIHNLDLYRYLSNFKGYWTPIKFNFILVQPGMNGE